MPSPDTDDSEHDQSEYDAMLADVDFVVGEIREKIEDGRIRSPEHDRVRVQYYKALSTLIRTRCKVLETKELEEMREKIERIEEQQTDDFR